MPEGLLNLFQEMNRTYLLADLLTYSIIKSQNKSMALIERVDTYGNL